MDYQEKVNNKLKLSSNQTMNIDKLRIRGQLSEEKYQSLLDEIAELKQLNQINVTTKGQLNSGLPSEYQIADNTKHEIDDVLSPIDEIWVTKMDDEGSEYQENYLDYEYSTHNVKQKLYISITNNLEILFTLNPNRFNNSENELITNMLIRSTSELTNAKITHVDFNLDVPYNTSKMHIKYKGNNSFSADGEQIKGKTKLHYYKLNVSKLRELIIYDKINERLDSKFNKADDSYLSKKYAQRLREQGTFLTRIELRLLKSKQVGSLLKDYRTALKGFTVQYRSYGNSDVIFGTFIDLNGVNHNKDRVKFNRQLNQQLKLKAKEIAELPYVTDTMIKNTKNA